jgi:hypothetical protein
MAGMLTPIPHTPLAERLRGEGRLREAEFSGNNTDDEVQFLPRRMSTEEMQRGYYQMLNQLFSPGAMFQRSRRLLDRLEPHIFQGGKPRSRDIRAALRSLWYQGVLRAPRRSYFELLWNGWRRDRIRAAEAKRASAQLQQQLQRLLDQRAAPTGAESTSLCFLLEKAREALLRTAPERGVEEIALWTASVRERIEAGTPSAEDLRSLYRAGCEFFVRQRRLHRFPGAYLVKAFNLAIKGLHYEIVMQGIVPHER